MRRRIEGIILLVVLAILVAGCNNTANQNQTANANANANANRNANANANASPALANTNANANRPPTREEYERDRDRYQREARESGRTIGSGANDGWLWVKTRFELATADDLRDSTINVDVDNGVVTLTGTVANAAQRARAEAVAKGVEDVRSVRNQLRVGTGNANANANANRGNANRGNANR